MQTAEFATPRGSNTSHQVKEYPSFGGYFMSIEQQDAVHGRVLRERGEARSKVALLQAETDKFVRLFHNLSGELRAFPESVHFHGQAVDPKHYRREAMFDKSDYPSQEKLASLTSDLRTASELLASLDAQVLSLEHA